MQILPEINKNPDTVYEVDPATFLYQVENAMLNAGETWNDSYACRLRWMQYCAGIWGYTTNNFTDCASFASGVYDNYNNVGKYATHIPHYVKFCLNRKLLTVICLMLLMYC